MRNTAQGSAGSRNIRKACRILTAAVCVLLAVILAAGAVGIYREGSARKAEDPRVSVYTPENTGEKLASLAPLFFVFLALLAVSIALGAGKPERPAKINGSVKPKPDGKHTGVIRAVLLITAAALILAGILNGSARDALIKAINICTECVGLG